MQTPGINFKLSISLPIGISKSVNPVSIRFPINRCSIDSLSKLQSDFYNLFSLKNHLIAVFFDLEKAYDCAWRHHSLKTTEEIGIKGHLSPSIQNFLTAYIQNIQGQNKLYLVRDL